MPECVHGGSQFRDHMLNASHGVGKLLHTLLRTLLGYGKLLHTLLRALLGRGKPLLRIRKPLHRTAKFREVVSRDKLVVHFHVKARDQVRLRWREGRLQPAPDFRQAHHEFPLLRLSMQRPTAPLPPATMN
ncbi:hypothetical protein LBMAG47_10980 [Planctomycetia bacterium]|nr:hypothetical protein LBMAG47_10980 [Planctomycetia bacterium]